MSDSESDEAESESGEQEIEISHEPTDSQIFDFIEEYASKIATARDRPVLYLLYPKYGMIQETNSIRLYQKFLEEGKFDNLDVVLHSTGGDLNEAYDIIKLCRRYTENEVTVFVPMRAMSAATLISLGADKVVLSETGKLGPLDPQIPHPNTGRYMPVRSVTDIPEVLEKALKPNSQDVPVGVKGEAIIKPIAEQVDPYYLTEHEKTADLAREYGQKLLKQRDISETYASRCLDYLIEYPTHSYSVDLQEIRSTPDLRNVIDAKGSREVNVDGDIEAWLMYMINFFLHWDFKYIGQGEPKMEPRIELIEPGSHQQLLSDIEGVDDDMIEEMEELAEEIEEPENLIEEINERNILDEDGTEESENEDDEDGTEESENEDDEDGTEESENEDDEDRSP